MSMDAVSNVFVSDQDVIWEQVDVGVKRKIMAYDDSLMVVKVAFETGGIGALHQHRHAQITHVNSGVFEVEINGDKKRLSTGDVFYVPPHMIHGAVCIETGMLIDTFSPMREDFFR